jgi:hypothetical protein
MWSFSELGVRRSCGEEEQGLGNKEAIIIDDMNDCFNVRTIFAATRISTFCVNAEKVVEVLEQLLPSLKSAYLDEFILDLVAHYGKQSITAGDVTVGVITIQVNKDLIDVSTSTHIPGLVEELRRLAHQNSGFKIVYAGRELV